MRVTAASSKGKTRGGGPHEMPAAGTKIRILYDAFVASPGIPIDIRTIRKSAGVNQNAYSYMKASLRDFYELDIRKIRNGVWVLAGRWNGSKYTDYIAPIVKGRR